MHYITLHFFVALLVLSILPVKGAASNKDSVRYEILMNSKLLEDLKINASLNASFNFTSRNLILLSSTDQFYLMGWGNLVPFGKKAKPVIGAFAFTPDSILMVIRNNELCYMDSTGNLSFVYKLPGAGMGISAGRYVMYLYERNSAKKKNALYALARGGKYTKVLEVPRPITSVEEYNGDILFSTENAVLRYNPATKSLKALATLPDKSAVESIALDPTTGRVYFSAGNLTGAILDNSPMVITDKLGGTLRYANGLIVFNPKSRLMIRLTGLETAINAPPPPPVTKPELEEKTEILTNASIIDLVRNQLSDDLIIHIISRSKVNFDLGVDAMIALSDQQVSSKVILAMKQAMRNQTSESKL
ncbi:MAG: hypothetical protein JW830_01375 [Bacteroidales bacterium]|nr:hypothetical protein [Bacteroidales bacterium]